MQWNHWLFAIVYFSAFLGGVYVLLRWKRRSRRPFGDDLKLLRGPGESQFRLYLQQEENDMGTSTTKPPNYM